MGDRVPHRLSPEALVPLAPGASPGGDGVNQLPVGERVTLPVEVRLKVPRGPGGAGPDDEPQVSLVQGLEVGRREHAGISHDDELLNTVGGLEGLHHGDDRGGLGPVALPAPDLEGETAAVDQQADDDLGVDPPLLGVTHPPQVVLPLGLEVQGGHACRHSARPPVLVTCSNRAWEIASR